MAPDSRHSVIKGVRFKNESVIILLQNWVQIPLDLTWHEALDHADADQRKLWLLTDDGYGVTWPTLGVTISVQSLEPAQHIKPANAEPSLPPPATPTR